MTEGGRFLFKTWAFLLQVRDLFLKFKRIQGVTPIINSKIWLLNKQVYIPFQHLVTRYCKMSKL